MDLRTAQHICNVVKRQIQTAYPELSLHFVIHKDGKREDAFIKDKYTLEEHPAGQHFTHYPDLPDAKKVLGKSRSRFVSMAHHHKPGFLGFNRENYYLGISFVNYERFENEISLRSHVLHMIWHAIILYLDHVKTRKNEEEEEDTGYIESYNLIIPKLTKEQWYHRNLMADVFSATVQSLQGKENAFRMLAKQRIEDTIAPVKGFHAEQYPLPVCIDALDLIYKNNFKRFKKVKNLVISAVKITQEVEKALDMPMIEQWQAFSLPAQEMAWGRRSQAEILGAAIFTSENVHAQSVADMIAERLHIKPDPVTSTQRYNPFAFHTANERTHIKLCTDHTRRLFETIKRKEDFSILLESARKQNKKIVENHVLGWCAGPLMAAARHIEHSRDDAFLHDTVREAQEIFDKELKAMEWITLEHFSHILFLRQRDGVELSLDNIIEIVVNNEEFASIYHALSATRQLETLHTQEQEKSKNKPQNISDFLSPNVLKDQ